MLLTSWVRNFRQSLQTRRRGRRRGMDWQRQALHGHSGRRFRLSEALEDRMLLTAFVVDQQLVNTTTGPINITNTTIDVDSDGTPEFDSIIVDAVSFDGIGGRAINIDLSDLTLTQIAVHDTTISGTQGQGVNISLDNVRLDSLSIEGSSINSSIGGGVDIDLTDVRLPELTIAQTTIAGGINAGLTVDVVSQSINSVIDEFDITDSTIDGIDINARGLRQTIFSARPTNPLELTVVDHGLQAGTLATVSGVEGLTAANTEDVIGLTTPADENLIVLENTDGTGQAPYAGGGVLTVFTDIGCMRITGNTIAGSSGDDGLSIDFTDVRAPHVEIENNVEIDSIDITLAQSPLDGLTIRNNAQIDGDRPQVDAINFNLTESTLTNLVIDQNTIRRNGAAGGEGVVFDATDSNVYGTFTNNVVDNTLGNGLLFNATATDEFVAENRGPAVFDFTGFSSETTLTTGIDASATTIEVVDARAFQPQQIILIGHERLFIASINDNTLTVLRGERGSLPVPHAAGARVRSVTSSASGTARSITGNTFSGNRFSGIAGTFLANSSIEADITGNQFTGNERRGIDLVAQDTHAQQTAVARGGISRTATTLNVTDSTPFDVFATPFNIQVDGEVMTVTEVVGNQLSVVRGVNGTRPAGHLTNATVTASHGDGLHVTIGGTATGTANTFDANELGAVRIELQDEAAGSFDFVGNSIINTASAVAINEHGLEVVLTGTNIDFEGTAILRRSEISQNVIGTDAVSSLQNALTAGTQVFLVEDGSQFAAGDTARIDGEVVTIASVSGNIVSLAAPTTDAHSAGSLMIRNTGGNDGRAIDVFFDEQTAIQDLQIRDNIIANNLDDGIRIRREDDAVTATVDPAVDQNRAITIAGNTISNNAINPVAEQLDTNVTRQFGAGIEVTALNGSLDEIDVEIRDNAVIANRRSAPGGGNPAASATNGIQFRSEADAQIIADVVNNVIIFNEGDGVNYTTRENSSTDKRDIGGKVVQNTISNNDQNGIELSGRFGVFNILEIGREGIDPATGESLGNTITENGLHGITVRRGGNATIVNNDLSFNGPDQGTGQFTAIGAATGGAEILGSGIHVANGDSNGSGPKPFLTDGTAPGTGGGDLDPQVSLAIKANNIEGNSGMGIDINSRVDVAQQTLLSSEGAPGVTVTIRDNLITQNLNDGIELSGPIQATLLGNFVDRNTGRGIDLMSFGIINDTPIERIRQSNYLIGDGLQSGRNVVVGNRQEGIYYVHTAEAQDQNLLSTNPNSRLPNGQVNAAPAAVLQIDTNLISDNGVDSALTATGLVMWIGSTGGVLSSGTFWTGNTYLGLETGLGTVGGVADVTETAFNSEFGLTQTTVSNGTRTEVNSRTNARIVNNSFEGNFGDDFSIRPFISTVDPLLTLGDALFDWIITSTPPYGVSRYESDPLSRLNLVFDANTGNGLDVRSGTVGYTNSEPQYKSRTPFFAATRQRDTTRIPSRTFLGPSRFSGLPQDNGQNDAIFPILDVQPVDVGNGVTELLVTFGDDIYGLYGTGPGQIPLTVAEGTTVEIFDVQGVNGDLHSANGNYQASQIALATGNNTLILQNTAGEDGPSYDSGGFLAINLNNTVPNRLPFQFPGMGPSTFRIAQGFDSSGVTAQNEFSQGDNFNGGPDGDGPNGQTDWGAWTPNPALNGVITNITSMGGGQQRITSPNHGLSDRRLVQISEVNGLPSVNNVFRVEVIDANTFDIFQTFDSSATAVDNGSYIDGGEWKTRDESFPDPLAPTFPVDNIVDVTPDPRAATPGVVTVEFSEEVTNFDVDDVYLALDGVPVDLASVIVQQNSATSFTVDLTAAGAVEGQYELIIDNTFPEATIVPISPDPITGPSGVVRINFTEPVTGVDIFDFVLSHDDGTSGGFQAIDLSETGANLAVTQISPEQYSIDLSSVTDDVGTYRLTLMAQRDDSTAVALDGISVAGGLVTINSQAHGLSTGQTVTLSGIRGTSLGAATAVNGTFRIVVLDNDNFRLFNETLTTPIAADDTGYLLSGPTSTWSFDPGIVDRVGRPYGVDRFNVLADTSDVWTRGNTAPTADIIDVNPDPRNSSLNSVLVRFSEPVRITQVNASDFVLTRDIGLGPVTVPLDAIANAPIALDDPTGSGFATLFELPNLIALTGAFPTDQPDQVVDYRLTLRNTDASRITDRQGSFLSFPAVDNWTFTPVGPSPTIATVFPDPRMTGATTVTVVFDEAVNGISTGDSVSDFFTLTRDSGDGNGPQPVQLTDPSNNMPLTLTMTSGTSVEFDLTPVTTDGGVSIDGTYLLTLNRGTGISAIGDGEPLSVDAVDSWIQDSQGPSAEILDIDPDPRVAAAGVVTVVFSERVTGIDRFNASTDFTLTRDRGDGAGAQPVSLAGIRVRPIAPVDAAGTPVADPFDSGTTLYSDRYVIDLSGPITDAFGTYTLTLTDTGSITDRTGNSYTFDSDATDTWKRLRKTINDRIIDLVFPGNPIPPYGGQAESSYEQPNYVVNDAQETFFVDMTPPEIVPGSATVQPDPRSTAAGLITIEFTESVTGFNLTDLVLTRDANDGNGPQPVSLSDLTLNEITPFEYTIDLNLKTGAPGTYSLSIQGTASLIQDLAGNPIQTGLIALDSWTVENTGPSATITVTPEFRNIATDNDPIVVTFSKDVDVSQVDVNDFRLERDNGSGFVVVTDSLAGSASTLDAAIDASQTTITIADGSVFPAAGGFRVTIGSEQLNVTSVSGNVLTVERGSEGSTATAHNQGDAVTLAPVTVTAAGSSTLVGNITSGTTTITVVDGSVFPSSGTFDVTIGSEVVTVTSVVGNTLTVTRGADATAHGNGEAVTVTFDDSFSLDLSASGLIDVMEARYRITLVATNSGIVDESAIELSSDVSAVWQLDRTTPTANVVDVLPDPLQLGPTVPSAGTVNILFDEPVENVDIADFELYRDGVLEPGLASLTVNAEPPEAGAPARRYTIDLSSLTGTVGTYELRVLAGGIQDLAGNNLETPNPVEFLDDEGRVLTLVGPTAGVAAADQWEARPDSVEPEVVSVVDSNAQTIPATVFNSVGVLKVTFSEEVTGFDVDDVTLTLNGSDVSLPAGSVSQFLGSKATWLLDLSGVTAEPGSYVLQIHNDGNMQAITDLNGNVLAEDTDILTPPGVATEIRWEFQIGEPNASIVPVAPNPRLRPAGVVTVNFSDDVNGVDISDFRLTRLPEGRSTALPVSLQSVDVVMSAQGPDQYILDLTSVTGAPGTYTLTLVSEGSGIESQTTMAPLRTDASQTWTTFDVIDLQTPLSSPQIDVTFGDAADAVPGDERVDTDAGTSGEQRSLRSAIQTANALTGDDTILLATGTYTLTIGGPVGENAAASGDLDITDTTGSLTIRGQGVAETMIDAGGLFRVFHVLDGATLILEDLTVTGGFVTGSDDGAGLRNDGGTVTLNNVRVTGNVSQDDGGGINNAGFMTIINSTLDMNTAAASGGAIRNVGRLTVINSTVGGRLDLSDPMVPIDERNQAGLNGGGLVNVGGGTAMIVGTTFSGNVAGASGGGVRNDAVTTAQATALASDTTDTQTTLTVSDATVFPAHEGFVIRIDTEDMLVTAVNTNTLTVVRGFNGTTAAAHTALSVTTQTSSLTLFNTTIADNSAGSRGGGLSTAGGLAVVANTLISGNSAVVDGPEVSTVSAPNSLLSAGNNLVLSAADAAGVFVQGTDLVGQNPLLAPLNDNGGPTLTHAILLGSPAIDAGQAVSDTTDQRGIPRVLGNGATDIGAYEFGGFFVNSTADSIDINPGDGLPLDVFGRSTLRAAVMEANALAANGSSTDNAIMLGSEVYDLSLTEIDRTAPTAAFTPVMPDPLAEAPTVTGDPALDPVDSVVVTFSEPVHGRASVAAALSLSSVRLTHDDGQGTVTVTTLDNIPGVLVEMTSQSEDTGETVYTITGLEDTFAADGMYTLELLVNDGGNSLVDFALTPNALAEEVMGSGIAATETFIRGLDVFAPTGTISQVTTPRTTNPGIVTLTFNEQVIGITGANFTLTYNDGINGQQNVDVSSISPQIVSETEIAFDLSSAFDFNGLSDVGDYVLTFDGSNVGDPSGNLFGQTLTTSWTVAQDTFAPIPTIEGVTPDPRIGSVGTVTVDFDEDVTGVDLTSAETDFDLWFDEDGRSGPIPEVQIDLSNIQVTQVSASQYTFDLSSVTTADGAYRLEVSSDGNVEDLAVPANPLTEDSPAVNLLGRAGIAAVEEFVIGDSLVPVVDPANLGQTQSTDEILRSLAGFSGTTVGGLDDAFASGMGVNVGAFNNMSNGTGDASLQVAVDGTGEFGNASGVFSATAGAIYDPVGPIQPADTTFESHIYFRSGTTGTRQTLGNLAGSLSTISGTPLDGVSTFTIGNLSFELTQQLEPLADMMGIQNGSVLTQTLRITNTGTATEDFEFVRYIDGDLQFDGSIADGGGRFILPSGEEVLFETDAGGGGTTATTFMGITGLGGTIPATNRYEIDLWPTFDNDLAAGNALTDSIFGDGDGDGFVDAGNEADVTLGLRNVFSLAAGGMDVYTTHTLFGSGAPNAVNVQTTLTPGFQYNPAAFGDLDVTSGSLTLIGTGSTGSMASTVNGNSIDRIFDVDEAASIMIQDAELAGGQVLDDRDGGGIRAFGSVELDNARLSGNSAGGNGGGLYVETDAAGSVTINDSEFEGNSADNGGGLFNNSETTVTITDSDFISNSATTDGGGIYNDRTGDLTLTGSTLTENSAGRNGGGFYNNDLANVAISDSTLTSNTAALGGGGLFNELAATATVANSTIAFNNATDGAGVYNDDGTVTISISAVSANTASTDGGGAFVTSNGVLNVSNSSFSGNMAAVNGGGLSSDGTVTLDNVRVIDNFAEQNGAGIANTRSLTLQQVTLTQNEAEQDGGGLWNAGIGSASITDTAVTDNMAARDGGGIHNSGSASLTFTRSSIADGTAAEKGGGLYQSSLGSVSIVNATISANAATDGGGIYSTSGLTFENSTLSTNTATNNGGGIDNNGGEVSFASATVFANVAGNAGGGIINESVFGEFSLKNTIVARNQINGNPPNADVDVSGVQFNSVGNNLIGDRGSVTTFIDGANGDVIGVAGNEVDPLLGPLQDNGGPTLTHSLLFGSPARDAGTNVGVLGTDQRGFARIFDGDGDGLATVDIGAFESGFVVNTFEDTTDILAGDQASADRDGNSSLRAAVMESNALAGDDTILLIPGTYTLTIAGRSEDAAASGDLDISDNLTIIGAGTDQTFIDAAELDRVFHVLPGARLNLKNLTIRGGNALEGGGLLNQGFTTLENVVVRDNTADFGAGLLNDLVTTALAADLTTTATTVMVTDGSVFPAQGVFDIRIGAEEIRVTAVSGDTYSVIRGVNGTTAVAHTAADNITLVQSMDLIDTVVASNAARIQGGGLFNRNELTLTRAVFSANTANSKGGGLYNESSVAAATNVLDSTFDSNVATVAGGGIYNNSAQGANPGRITISGSTLSNNHAGVRGGAIFNNDIVTLLNSTISTNSANSIGGGIYNAVLLDPADGVTVLSAGDATLTNVTVVRNTSDGTGGGIVNVDGATTSLRNTIVAANSASTSNVDLQGGFTSLGTNFVGQADQSTGLTNGVMGDQVGSASSPFDPVIGPLTDNGGPTLTHALQTGSPAIDAGDNSGGEPVDQRAGRRPTDNTADIGAFEIQENRISIVDLEKLEGPGGSTLFVFSVILEQTTAEPISVDFTTFQGTARSGSDFQPVAGTLMFDPGDLTRTITVEVFGDTTPEDDETFQIILSNPVNGVLTRSSATGTILNDDAFVQVDDVDIAEGDSGQTNAVFTVSLSAPLQETATVTYSTADDTANAGNDYETRSGTLTFLPGETSMTVEVPINGDLIVEPHETFFLNLTSAVGASGDNLTVLGGQGVGTIQNDDILISVTADSVPVAENAGTYPFTVSLSQPNAFDVKVDVSTVNGTATSGLDYTALDNVTVTIPAGMTSVPVDVAILNDGTFEGGPGTTETFNLELQSGTVTRNDVANANAVLGGPATGEIEDDEPRPIEFLIRLNTAGDTIEVVQDDGINPPAVIQSTMDLVAAYSVDGTNSNDVFIVDFVNGNPIPTNGLTVHGLDQTSGDALELRDSSGTYPTATNIVYSAADANSGLIDIDGSIVNYTGLEPVTDSLDAVNRTFDSTGVSSDHDISVSDAGGMTVINDNGTTAFESITFRNPTTSLTLNAGDGDNTISLNAIDSAFAASFTLNAGGGGDSIDASGFNHAAAINGEAGDDVITGSANDDTISGGLGADNLSGGDGADTIRGNDSINPDDDASDTIFGNGGADVLDGEGGDDVIDGGLAGDMITGGAGDDQLTGGSGNDTISGGDGADNVLGGDGNDDLQGDAGNDTLDGEAGEDTVDGGADDDVVNGGADDDTVLGGAGNDDVNGNDGDDDVQGGTGNDTLDGGAGTNMLDGGDDTDTISVTATGTQNITLTDSDLTVGGEIVTYTSVEQFILNGSDQANNIDASGYSGDVSIFGGDGNDTLTGGSGNDSIVGEGGNDTVSGGAGSDTLLGGAGRDSLDGGVGDDNVSGQSGADTLDGGDGNDTLSGGDDPDSILGGDGNDDASGGTGNDTLEGGLGDDTLRGDAGNDQMSGGEDDDSLFGGGGADNLLGDAGDDKLIGNSGSDTLEGGAGEDSALGGSGDDLLIGGDGNDILDGQGSSNDVITLPGTTLDDTFTIDRSEALVLLRKTSGTPYSAILRRAERVELNTLDGNDSVTVGDLTGADGFSTFVLDLGTGDDVLAAGSNRNTAFTFAVSAGAGNDSLFGGEGADVLNGDAGNDLIHGRGGNDTLTGGQGTDFIVGFAGDDVISGDEDNDTLLGSAGRDIINGNDGNDSIRGNGGFDTIDGGDGEDTLRGDGSGDDIYGGAGRDLIDGGGGNDDIFAGDGNDIIKGGAGEDYILAGSGNDAISGGAANDRIVGNAGRDLLLGEDGNDTLIGGAQQDLLVAGNGADFLRGNGSRNDTLVGENGGDTPDPGDFFHPADAAEVDNAFILDPGVFDLFNF